MAELNINGLRKTYSGGKAPATDDISLTVADGEFMVLLGPSGCGKTTLLRMVAGLEKPDSGSISINGRDVTYLSPRHRNIAMVFQSYAVFPHKKVRDNIGFGLAMRKADAAAIAKKVDWAAELLGLQPYLDRLPAQLSGGQRQRVAVARAIVMEPDLLLMDEPLSNLDALLRLNFRAELKKLVSDLGTTCVYVTHDQVEALSLSDRVAVMQDGRIVQCDRPLEIYEKPASVFVGGFIGSPPMNFLSGTIDSGPAFTVEDHSIPLPAFHASHVGRPARLGVRAESIGHSSTPGGDTIPAVAEVVESLGSSTLITARIGDQMLKVQAPNEFRPAAGDPLHLALPADKVRLFDADTHLALDEGHDHAAA
jgi:multiple sugar transport system ATP-binding protein